MLGKIRVFIVDDDYYMRQALLALLWKEPGVKVVGMASCPEELIYMASKGDIQEKADVILLDMKYVGKVRTLRGITLGIADDPVMQAQQEQFPVASLIGELSPLATALGPNIGSRMAGRVAGRIAPAREAAGEAAPDDGSPSVDGPEDARRRRRPDHAAPVARGSAAGSKAGFFSAVCASTSLR